MKNLITPSKRRNRTASVLRTRPVQIKLVGNGFRLIMLQLSAKLALKQFN